MTAVDVIRARAPGFAPRIAVVLGSGLGIFADEGANVIITLIFSYNIKSLRADAPRGTEHRQSF